MIKTAGGRALARVGDVTDPKLVGELVDETTCQLGPITLLVNNAGTAGPAGKDWEVDADEWWRCVEVSVRGAFLCTQTVLPGMIQQGGGRIVHMASRTGIGPRPQYTATSVAKTALIRLAEGLELSGAEHGINVFAINPGVVPTRLLLSYNVEFPASMLVSPERAGELCVRLASGHYDALSGRFLSIDDDLDALLARADEIAQRELYLLRLKT